MINLIEKYDQELEQDIRALEDYIDKDEEMAIIFGTDHGSSKKEMEEAARRERRKGKHLHFYFYYPNCMGTDELLSILEKLRQALQMLPFRIYLRWPKDYSRSLILEIITEHDKFYFNTTVLDDYELREFVEYVWALIPFYEHMPSYGMHHCYPSLGLIKLVTKLGMKYKDKQVLVKLPVEDDMAMDVLYRVVKEVGIDFEHAKLE